MTAATDHTAAARRAIGWALFGLFLAGLGLALTALGIGDSPAEREAQQWAECIESAHEFGFDPPGGVEAWCVTTTRSDQ